MPNHDTSTYQMWVCEMSKCVALKAERRRHCPTWDGRPVCSQGSWSGRRCFLFSRKEWPRKELGLSQNELVTVKSATDIVKHMRKQYLGKVLHHAITYTIYKKIGPLDLSSWQPKQAQFTWVHSWKLLLWIDLLSCYSLILVYTWIYKYVYENMGMETFTINSCQVSDTWNFEYCKVAFSLPR